MNEFLTSLSSGQPILWALFVLATITTTALALTLSWEIVFRLAARLQRNRTEVGNQDVFS